MLISPFSSVFFIPSRGFDGRECPFMQFFAVGDRACLQVIRTSEEQAKNCKLVRLDDATAPESLITPDSHQIGSMYVDWYCVALDSEGCYTLAVAEQESEPFEVTSDPGKIGGSVLFEFSPSGNNVRGDVVPIVDGERIFFSIRMPGGFKASGYDFSIDNEQFVTQEADIVELYARESTQETLTIGWSRGVPIWFGQMLNRLLTCRYVYINGLRYARYESSVPEKEQTAEGVNSFVFTQKLQRINFLEPTKQ